MKELKLAWYPPTWETSDDIFISELYGRVGPTSRVLDAGAGSGELFSFDLKSRVNEIIGVDLDSRVEGNPRLHKGIVSDLTNIPISTGYFDLVFTRFLFEHLRDPHPLLSELNRVLKPNGSLLFLTPNRWHYVALAAQATPHSFHNWYNHIIRGRNVEDTFPTLYRLNSLRTIRRELTSAGFLEEKIFRHENPPNYLLFSKVSFYLGLSYERMVNHFQTLSFLRTHFIGIYRKQP